MRYEKVNISSKEIPKMVLIGKDLSSEEKGEFMDFLKAYQDIFAWGYEDLKGFMNGKFKHQIPLKLGSTPFQKKQRQFNLKVSDAIFNEVDKMFKAKIIYPIHHSMWVANIVLVKKKNCEIRICVKFQNLN